MKSLFACAAFLAAANALELEAAVTSQEEQDFMIHLAQQGQDIANVDDYSLRSQLFARQDRWIKKHNLEASTDPDAAVFGHNQFSTMTPGEKLQSMGISKKIRKWVKKWIKRRQEKYGDDSDDTEPEPESEESETDDNNGPVSPTDEEGEEGDYTDENGGIDWRVRGAVGNVKNQGSCGSCWAFAAVSQLESLNYIKSGNYQYLSEQQLVDCATRGNNGCNGGFMSYAFDYYANANGMVAEDKYPYTARQGTCRGSQIANTGIKTKSYSSVKQGWSAAQWKAELQKNPVSIAVAAGNNYFMQYSSGILDTNRCPTSIDHAVNMVGWGVSDSGKEYWIIRNSWGTAWGENGYIRIAIKPSGNGVCLAQYLAVTASLQ